MESLEERLRKLEYHQRLLLDMVEPNTHPFDKLVIRKGLSEEEVAETLALCGKLNEEYERQIEEGYVSFTKLLTQFVGMLHPGLEAVETIESLYYQGIYRKLMSRLKEEAANIRD
ncbi:DUF1878 family protein [Bacillus marinisedimentorum]|uniref:DUF1878 family protein n=1 Tax=Bacillus marinisedimentorum TaxID=1821260 RepID=UPI0007DF87B8|nr:DUF1878 family protein [Bacillus marinisedimentorum]